MSIVEWHDDLSIGVPEIDAQHKRLIAMVNEVDEAIRLRHGADISAGALRRLCDYAVEHFAAEEALMDPDAYADYDRHMGQHMECTDKALEFLQTMDTGGEVDMAGFLAFLTGWVREHILEVDQGLGRHLREKASA